MAVTDPAVVPAEVYEAAALAAAETVVGAGLPFPPLPVPRYQSGRVGAWCCEKRLIPAMRGYFQGPQLLDTPVTLLKKDADVWMSVTPMEIESQMPHAAAAHGKVVICGLGLGCMAYAVAARRDVSEVLVIERDADVRDQFFAFSGFEGWPQKDKITIIAADALEFCCSDADFLYADIWLHYRMDRMLADMHTIYAHCPAPACGYWGQEIDMVDYARAKGRTDFAAADVTDFAAAAGLPLIGQNQPDYPALCVAAADNPLIGAQRRP